jgi:oligopeptide transport system ATP-binding protein
MGHPILEVNGLTKTFKKGKTAFNAVDNVTFSIYEGEIFGIVGESGCGKSTIAKMVTHIIPSDGGQIVFLGRDITNIKKSELNNIYRNMQMVFQDAPGSFNPRIKVGEAIREVFCNLCSGDVQKNRNIQNKEIIRLLSWVGLREEYADRYPHELSGGECQRVAIARALAVNPKLLICDEATSALDVSAQARVVEILANLRRMLNMAILFISHDLPLVSCLCDRVYVMCDGQQIETGDTNKIISSPQHEYTKTLLDSVLYVDSIS